jgi:hypothetical protein
VPTGRALLDYTNLYVRFGLGRDFDPAHPVWREYLAGLAHDDGEWTHAFYLRRPEAAPPALIATFGCFSYARLGPDRIRLHFVNADGDGQSPLSRARRGRRRAELGALFEHVRRTERGPVRVVGASWLYNIEAYRRLFPEPYLATARVLPRRFRHMPLWGQFVDRHGEVRAPTVFAFLQRLRRQADVEGLDRCFPLPVLTVEAPVSVFSELDGV